MSIFIVSAIIVGLSIIVGSIIIGRHISESNSEKQIGSYQIIKVDGSDIVILDTRTGQYWRKPIVENSSIKYNSNETTKYA